MREEHPGEHFFIFPSFVNSLFAAFPARVLNLFQDADI
jgi:hypothetical protein